MLFDNVAFPLVDDLIHGKNGECQALHVREIPTFLKEPFVYPYTFCQQ